MKRKQLPCSTQSHQLVGDHSSQTSFIIREKCGWVWDGLRVGELPGWVGLVCLLCVSLSDN